MGTFCTFLLVVFFRTRPPIYIEIDSCLTNTEQKISWHSFLRHDVYVLVAVALTLQVSVRPIRNDGDETILCYISFRDVTQQQPAVANSNETSSLVDGTCHESKLNSTLSQQTCSFLQNITCWQYRNRSLDVRRSPTFYECQWFVHCLYKLFANSFYSKTVENVGLVAESPVSDLNLPKTFLFIDE